MPSSFYHDSCFVAQLGMAPCSIAIFFTVTTLLEGLGLDAVKEKLKSKWRETLTTNFKVWYVA